MLMSDPFNLSLGSCHSIGGLSFNSESSHQLDSQDLARFRHFSIEETTPTASWIPRRVHHQNSLSIKLMPIVERDIRKEDESTSCTTLDVFSNPCFGDVSTLTNIGKELEKVLDQAKKELEKILGVTITLRESEWDIHFHESDPATESSADSKHEWTDKCTHKSGVKRVIFHYDNKTKVSKPYQEEYLQTFPELDVTPCWTQDRRTSMEQKLSCQQFECGLSRGTKFTSTEFIDDRVIQWLKNIEGHDFTTCFSQENSEACGAGSTECGLERSIASQNLSESSFEEAGKSDNSDGEEDHYDSSTSSIYMPENIGDIAERIEEYINYCGATDQESDESFLRSNQQEQMRLDIQEEMNNYINPEYVENYRDDVDFYFGDFLNHVKEMKSLFNKNWKTFCQYNIQEPVINIASSMSDDGNYFTFPLREMWKFTQGCEAHIDLFDSLDRLEKILELNLLKVHLVRLVYDKDSKQGEFDPSLVKLGISIRRSSNAFDDDFIFTKKLYETEKLDVDKLASLIVGWVRLAPPVTLPEELLNGIDDYISCDRLVN